MEHIGKWIILGEAGKSADGHKLYMARCALCGYTKGPTKLWNIERTAYNGTCCHQIVVGWPTRRLGTVYNNMVRRCHDHKSKDYRFYGGKGVCVCAEWLKDKQKFVEWAMSHGYAEDLTIDRIDPKGDYEPSNCRWIPNKENAKLKRTTRLLTIDGKTDSLSGWAKAFDIPKTTVVGGVKNKTDEEAIEYIKKHSGIAQ